MKDYLRTLGTVSAFALLAAITPLAAQSANSRGGQDHGQGMHGAGHGHGGTVNEATKAFAEANAKMHAGMNIAFTGDADVDFVRGMIPHHQGAIDMARIVLQHGKDPEIRKLASEIIKAQEAEISMMHEWLKKRGLE